MEYKMEIKKEIEDDYWNQIPVKSELPTQDQNPHSDNFCKTEGISRDQPPDGSTSSSLDVKPKIEKQQNDGPKEVVEFVIKEVQSSEQKFYCPQCPDFFMNEVELSQHIISHLQSDRFPCNFCGKTFKNPTYLKQHIKRHTTNEAEFQCEMCTKTFRYRTSVKRHILEFHLGKKPYELSSNRFTCAECGKIFWHKAKYERHLLKHTDVKNVGCPLCDKKFKHKFYLDRHMSVHSEEKPFTCNLCNKAFRQEYYLKKHLARHNHKAYKCNYCQRSHRDIEGLKSHMDLFHRGLPIDIQSECDPIACTVCSEIFENLDNLKKHVKIHPIDKPFECAICGKTYINKRRIRDHIGFAHDRMNKSYRKNRKPRAKKPREKKVPDLKCKICLKDFKARKYLTRHMKTHDKERPSFQCKICGKKLMHRANLQSHVLSHQNIKEPSIIKCPKCWKTYMKKKCFEKHMEKHHKDSSKDQVVVKIEQDESRLETVIECSDTIKTEPDFEYEIQENDY